MTTTKYGGYLPNDIPESPVAVLSLAAQHVLTMFPATVLCAILTGFDIGVMIFATGLATIVALVGAYITRRTFIPLYYGGSFSYIAAVAGIVAAYGSDGTRVAQVGIVGTALVNICAGLLIHRAGKASLDKVLPPIVTGSVAIVIGIALSKTALDMASGYCCLKSPEGLPIASGAWWTVALVTLLSTVILSVYVRGKGLLGMLPVLAGAVVGYLCALPLGLVDFQPVMTAAVFRLPPFSLPAFGHPGAWSALLAIAPIAIATIPESTAHLYQISLYVDRLAEEMGKEPVRLSRLIGLNLILDGLADGVNGLIGAPAGTNYGENNSLMVISRNYSGPVLIVAGVIAMLLGFVGTLAAIVQTLPTAVTGGLSIYLFGVIGIQGIALMMSERVNLFDPRQLAIGAIILVIGIGGNFFPGGNLPLGSGIPAIAAASVAGIVVNAIFIIFPLKEEVEQDI